MTERIPDSLQEWAMERSFDERLRLAVLTAQTALQMMKSLNNKEDSK